MTVPDTLDAVLRQDGGRCLAALIARTGDFALAEDCLQEAALSALTHWRRGVPDRPAAWLLRVASRKAIDRLRHGQRGQAVQATLERLAVAEAEEAEDIPDDRLRLIFTCCHPALEPKSQVALTLRTVCGLTTAEIARAFLDSEPTMGQRLSRAKATIAAARIPFAVPGRGEWAERLGAVLTCAYLIFTTGYAGEKRSKAQAPCTPSPLPPPEAEARAGGLRSPRRGTRRDSPGGVFGAKLKGGARDLCEEGVFLLRLVDGLCPGEAEVEGALALILLTHARRAARGAGGVTVPPAAQDRRLWDGAALAEGRTFLDRAFSRRRPGPFQIKAAIADCQMAEGGPDWPQIVGLYDVLLRMEPTPVIALNRAVALAETGEAGRALALVEGLAGPLADYQPYHAARAALLARVGRWSESRAAYDRALQGAGSEDAAFLIAAREKLPLAGQS